MTPHLRVVDLRTVSPSRWFEAGPSVDSPELALAQLVAALSDASVLCLLALQGDEVVGQIDGTFVGTGALRLGWVEYGPGRLDRGPVAGALVEAAIATARTRAGVRFVESRPTEATPDVHELTRAFATAGMRRVAQSHVFERDLASVRAAEVSRVDDLDVDLLDRVHGTSMDRVHRQGWDPAAACVAELRAASPGSGWCLRRGGTNVAFAWTVVQDGVGWIADVGVDPEHRGQGLGRTVLGAAVAGLLQSGISCVRAVIDDENAASIGLHRSLGFRALDGASWVWRLRLRPG